MSYLMINHDDSKRVFKKIIFSGDPRDYFFSYEIVPTVLRDIVLIVDEQGKFLEGWEGRFNKVATILCSLRNYIIIGDAILARVEGDSIVPLTMRDTERLYYHFGKV